MGMIPFDTPFYLTSYIKSNAAGTYGHLASMYLIYFSDAESTLKAWN